MSSVYYLDRILYFVRAEGGARAPKAPPLNTPLPYMATEGTCLMFVNTQSAVGGYYSDVKSPWCVYIKMDTYVPIIYS